MKVFICYAEGDGELARRLAQGLAREELDVWFDQFEVFPGDNWAESIAKALNESESMVVLYTARAASSETVQRNVGFALGNVRYRERVVPVRIESAPLDVVPWALRKHLVNIADPAQLEASMKTIAGALLVPA